MSFKFEPGDRSAAEGVRRIAAEQIDAAMSEITQPDDEANAIHAVRKRSKRLRALIKLVRDDFPDYAKENAAIRNAAQGLSHLRDADVLGETLEDVAGQEVAIDAGDLDEFRRLLGARADRVKAEVDKGKALADFRSEFQAVRGRLGRWRFERGEFGLIRKGFAKTYRRARRDMRAVAKGGTAEESHDWRKMVKAHFYHLCLLREVAPNLLSGQRDLANEMGEVLGKQHDMSVFRAALEEDASLRPMAACAPLLAALDKRERELGEEAMRMGSELLAERPSHLLERVERYWTGWRKQAGSDDGTRDRAEVPRAA